MFRDFDLQRLRRVPRFSFCFRYPLHHGDFHEYREQGRLRGRYAAKPLYGRLVNGRVDRSAGFNGQVAVVFIPARARSERGIKLLLTRTPKSRLVKADGHRNWPVIRAVAERAIQRMLKRSAA